MCACVRVCLCASISIIDLNILLIQYFQRFRWFCVRNLGNFVTMYNKRAIFIVLYMIILIKIKMPSGSSDRTIKKFQFSSRVVCHILVCFFAGFRLRTMLHAPILPIWSWHSKPIATISIGIYAYLKRKTSIYVFKYVVHALHTHANGLFALLWYCRLDAPPYIRIIMNIVCTS